MRVTAWIVSGFATLSICLSLPAAAQDAGPEDGILCCNGLERFSFDGDSVLTTTGRAGIFRSDNRGGRWRRSMQGLVAPNGVAPQVVFVCQAPSSPKTLYALAGIGAGTSTFNGIFSSADFGASWTRRGAVDTGFGFARCDVDPDDPRTVYVAPLSQRPLKSTDGGQTFQVLGPNIPAFAQFATVYPVRGAIYVATEEEVFVSTDGGLKFGRLRLPAGLVGGFSAAIDGRVLFVDIGDRKTFAFQTYRSADGGSSFVVVNGLSGGSASLMQFDPTQPSRVYVTDLLLRVSSDGGLNFFAVAPSNDPRFLGVPRELGVDARGSVYVGTLAGPFRSDDGGLTFEPLLNEWRASAVNDLAFDAAGKLLVGVLNTLVVFKQTGERTFTALGLNPVLSADGFRSATAVAGSPSDANVLLVATFGGGGLYRTEDGGSSWNLASVTGNPTNFNLARMTFADSSRVYLVMPTISAPGLYRSADAGRTFARLSTLSLGAVAVDPTNVDVLYVGSFAGEGLFKSLDGGQTLQSLQLGAFSALAVDRRNPQVVYAGERFGQVIRSLDGGQTFAPASAGLAGAGVHAFAQDAQGTLFVWLRAGGVFSSRDFASSWQPVDTGEALRRSGVEAGRGSLVADPHHPGRVYLGNSGVIRIDAGVQ